MREYVRNVKKIKYRKSSTTLRETQDSSEIAILKNAILKITTFYKIKTNRFCLFLK